MGGKCRKGNSICRFSPEIKKSAKLNMHVRPVSAHFGEEQKEAKLKLSHSRKLSRVEMISIRKFSEKVKCSASFIGFVITGSRNILKLKIKFKKVK